MTTPVEYRVPKGRLWWLFFTAVPTVALGWTLMAPSYGWWFPTPALSPMGREIDGLFYMILTVVTIVFFGTNLALCYVLWKFQDRGQESKGWFTHGSHTLEVIWTIAPAGVLLFISLIQLDVWARYRMTKKFAPEVRYNQIAEVTARQFEWRIRYPHPSRVFKSDADVQNWLKERKPDDVYAVNDLHVPSGRDVVIYLRTEDVLHSFYIPDLRVKQDAVPGFSIEVQFHADKSGQYELVCAELCGWGHYKMKGRVTAEPLADYQAHVQRLSDAQNDDGVPDEPAAETASR